MLHLHLKRICCHRQQRAVNVSQLGWWWGGGVGVLPDFPHLLCQLSGQRWEHLHLLFSLPHSVLLPLPPLYPRLTLTHRTTGLNSSRQESLALRCRDWAPDCKAGCSTTSYASWPKMNVFASGRSLYSKIYFFFWYYFSHSFWFNLASFDYY